MQSMTGSMAGSGTRLASQAMRVVGGSARGRKLSAPPGLAVRPTADRVRESVFNMLASMNAVWGVAVVDLFAGTGAMGIEALSRGAASAVFVDSDPVAVNAVNANLAAVKLDGGRVVQADVLRWLASAPTFDLALCDPPYAFEAWAELFGALRADVVVAESNREVEPGDGWEVLKTRRYGGTVVTLARQTKGGA